jgi:hypothetical protein
MPLCCEAKQGAWGGRISKRGNIVDFNVTKILDISQKIIPFFEKILMHPPTLGHMSKI